MVGNTPLLAIAYAYRGERPLVYAKAEALNMTGSVKNCGWRSTFSAAPTRREPSLRAR